MSATFSRTLNALKSDNPRRRLNWLAVGVAVLGAWLGWFFLAEVPVYEATPNAHLEVSGQAHPVQAPVGGRVVRVRMVLGQEVAPGDVLVELDAEAERLRLEETRARINALTSQRTALASELRAEELAEGQGTQGAEAAVAEAKARAQEAEASARLAEEELARIRTLAQAGAVAEAEVQRAQSTAQQRRAAETCLGAQVLDDHRFLREEGVPSLGVAAGADCRPADEPFLPAHARPQEQPFAARKELQNL